MNATIKSQARALRLSGLLQSLEVRLQEARGNDLTHDEFLELIFNDELNVRGQRKIERRTKSAGFREPRTLENFDFGFNPKIDRRLIHNLAAGAFIDQKRDVLMVGPPSQKQ
jgi:DNA replication protein DnaC